MPCNTWPFPKRFSRQTTKIAGGNFVGPSSPEAFLRRYFAPAPVRRERSHRQIACRRWPSLQEGWTGPDLKQVAGVEGLL